jgi:wyosine [tRNA(Phe)-imidazoG37] synthetase (radical SAM superfamily)
MRIRHTQYRHLFGPVPSRRLGRSLGIDLVPHKICTLDCIYCECGATTLRTLERRAWVDPDAVLAELGSWLAAADAAGGAAAVADYLTFSGAGEPTLHADLGRIAAELAARTDVPLALLTNSTLLGDPALRAELAPLALVCPSLDAVSQDVFERLNRPHPGLTAAGLVDALVALRQDFGGRIWLEILLVEGINDTDAELDLLAAAVRRIRPDRVQCNTAVRPGTDPSVTAASQASLTRALARLGPLAEPVATFVAGPPSPEPPAPALNPVHESELVQALLAVVRRRPETLARLAASLGHDEPSLARVARRLEAQGRLRTERRGGETYVVAIAREP